MSLSALGADDFKLPGSANTLRVDIYAMDDTQLVRALVKLKAIPTEAGKPTAWELEFIDGVAHYWARWYKLAWKQRQTGRRILIERLVRVIRAGLIHQWKMEDT
jgi:hypothetical protein